MGWRPGQGVGPRVSWRARKIQDLLAAGESIHGVDIDALEDEDEEAKRHMYPPRDTLVPRVSMKTDVHGLGFKAGAGLMESLGEKRPQTEGPKLAGAPDTVLSSETSLTGLLNPLSFPRPNSRFRAWRVERGRR
jgi:G patch domain-containing protein 1